MRSFRKIVPLVGLLGLTIALTACREYVILPPMPEKQVNKEILAEPYLSGDIYVCPVPLAPLSSDTKQRLIQKNNLPGFSKRQLTFTMCIDGMTVYREGGFIHVVVPSDSLFVANSADLKYIAMRRLSLVAEYIKRYCTGLITIKAYTDNTLREPLRLPISKQQAREVETYLWGQGVPIAQMFSEGYADSNPTGNNKTQPGSAANRRIEILF